MDYTPKAYFDASLQSAADKLEILAENLRQQKYSNWQKIKLDISNMQEADSKTTVSGLKKIIGPVIYFFQLDSATQNHLFVERIRSYKSTGDSDNGETVKRKCVRVHNDDDTNFETHILYVGSAGSSFHTRVKQHLGFGPKGTYALQLVHWGKGFDLSLDLYWMELPQESSEYRYDIEDALAEQMRPLVGKRGTN